MSVIVVRGLAGRQKEGGRRFKKVKMKSKGGKANHPTMGTDPL